MESLIPIITQVISGVAGGNIAGAVKQLNLGTTANSVVGGVGGVLLSQLTNYLTHGGLQSVVSSGLLQQVLSSGGGGMILTALAGLVKNLAQNNRA